VGVFASRAKFSIMPFNTNAFKIIRPVSNCKPGGKKFRNRACYSLLFFAYFIPQMLPVFGAFPSQPKVVLGPLQEFACVHQTQTGLHWVNDRRHFFCEQ
jgi:hypothetical protein